MVPVALKEKKGLARLLLSSNSHSPQSIRALSRSARVVPRRRKKKGEGKKKENPSPCPGRQQPMGGERKEQRGGISPSLHYHHLLLFYALRFAQDAVERLTDGMGLKKKEGKEPSFGRPFHLRYFVTNRNLPKCRDAGAMRGEGGKKGRKRLRARSSRSPIFPSLYAGGTSSKS